MIVQFPDEEHLERCFASEEYRRIMAMRTESVDARALKVIKGGMKGVIPVLILVSAISLFVRLSGGGSALLGMVGIIIVIMLPIGIISSRIMWKKGIITVEDVKQK